MSLAMVSFSHSVSLIGGDGCIVYRPLPILLKAYWVKVRYIPKFPISICFANREFLAVGRMEINCAAQELSKIIPPSGLTCGAYMQNYIASAGGYLTNPDATTDCLFCSSRTTDQFLSSSFNIFYSHRWRNFGLLIGYTIFNVSPPPSSLSFLRN